jgi:D-arabinose 1-dehydrogenase-like Zn-dependent alcohol dehydrogenase
MMLRGRILAVLGTRLIAVFYVKAFRLLEAVDVPKPKAGSGQVVIKAGRAGLCHTPTWH